MSVASPGGVWSVVVYIPVYMANQGLDGPEPPVRLLTAAGSAHGHVCPGARRGSVRRPMRRLVRRLTAPASARVPVNPGVRATGSQKADYRPIEALYATIPSNTSITQQIVGFLTFSSRCLERGGRREYRRLGVKRPGWVIPSARRAVVGPPPRRRQGCAHPRRPSPPRWGSSHRSRSRGVRLRGRHRRRSLPTRPPALPRPAGTVQNRPTERPCMGRTHHDALSTRFT